MVRAGVTPNNEQGTSWNRVEHDFSVNKLEAGGNCLWVYARDNLMYVRTGMGYQSSSPNRIGQEKKFIFFFAPILTFNSADGTFI